MPSIRDLAHTETLAAIRRHLTTQRILEDAITVQQIPAPTFAEADRATFIRERFERHGLQDIHIDDVHNVYGRWPGGTPDSPALLVSAHTDTVFPAETDLSVRTEQDRVSGPGLGDNSLGVAGLLALLEVLDTFQLHPAADVWFAANSREEGLGDLGGIRAIWQALGARLGAAIVVEGMALGRIYHAGIAVRRLHITCEAPGGHSWLHFGQPSATHGLMALGARIIALTPPSQPRTTYNIGLLKGGHSVNSLATSAELYLDLRSEDPGMLAALEDEVRQAVDAVQHPKLKFSINIVGDRPAGRINLDHPLVTLAASALDMISHTPVYEIGSTDANFLLANGLPTVTIGISYGGHAHRLDEYIETRPIADGTWQLVLLALAAVDDLRHWPKPGEA